MFNENYRGIHDAIATVRANLSEAGHSLDDIVCLTNRMAEDMATVAVAPDAAEARRWMEWLNGIVLAIRSIDATAKRNISHDETLETTRPDLPDVTAAIALPEDGQQPQPRLAV